MIGVVSMPDKWRKVGKTLPYIKLELSFLAFPYLTGLVWNQVGKYFESLLSIYM